MPFILIPVSIPSITKDGRVATAVRRMGNVKKCRSNTAGNADSNVPSMDEMMMDSSVSPPLVTWCANTTMSRCTIMYMYSE